MKNTLLIALFACSISFSATAQNQVEYNINTVTPIVNYTANDLLVFPNPVLGTAHIQLITIPVSNVHVDIIDMNGNFVRSYQYVPGTINLEVDMSRIPVGLYSVRVYGKDIGFHNLKVVKQ